MKKLIYSLVVLFVVATMFSCKSHSKCAAYSKADVQNIQKPS